MKKLIYAGILSVIGFGVVNAQTPDEVKKEESYEYSRSGEDMSYEAESETTIKTDSTELTVEKEVERSKGDTESTAGKALDKVGGAAKDAGGAVKDGAKWTADKAKHNKVTKEVFDQPDDVDEKDMEANKECEENCEDATSRLENSDENSADKTEKAAEEGSAEIDNAGEEVSDEIEDANDKDVESKVILD